MKAVKRNIPVEDRRMMRGLPVKVGSILVVLLSLVVPAVVKAQTATPAIEDITGEYHFLGPFDTLALLQEDQMLKGYIDVFQGESESDVVLSYPITIGSRKGNHVEFRTRRIHEKYYRFSGIVQRGSGHHAGDPDYLRLVGVLQTITLHEGAEKENVSRRDVVFKSKGKAEKQP